MAINALGPDAVFRCVSSASATPFSPDLLTAPLLRAVESVAITRRYLAADGLELHFTPEFFHFETASGSRSALRFSLLASQI